MQEIQKCVNERLDPADYRRDEIRLERVSCGWSPLGIGAGALRPAVVLI